MSEAVTTTAFYQPAARAIAVYLAQQLRILPGQQYRVVSATCGPRVLVLSLQVNPAYAPRITAMQEQLSMAVGLDREFRVRVLRGQRGNLAVEIPKPRGLWYNVPVAALPRRRGLVASLGLDADHRPQLLNFADPLAAHALVVGATASGKTNVGRLLVYDLVSQNTPEQVRLLLIDTRKQGLGWRSFACVPHLLHPIIAEEQADARALAWAAAEIDRRAAEHRTTPRVFICIDEAQALLDDPGLARLIADLASVGRELGIHLIVAIQNPTARQMGDSTIRANLATRLVCKVMDGVTTRVATGQSDSGAERLTGAGDMLLVQQDRITRLTAALVTGQDMAQLPRVEQTARLDLEACADPDRARGAAEIVRARRGPRPDPLEFDWSGNWWACWARDRKS